MQVTRMDLDGTGSPMGLVGKILKAEPGLTFPVPIEDLAYNLDIREIRVLGADGFEGGLITDEGRSEGFILVNGASHPTRRRFTIGHELGHFLMTHHRPKEGDQFRCSREDMRRFSGQPLSDAAKWEAEANEFSSLILMPPTLWQKEMAKLRDPDLGQIPVLAKAFQVSKEAAARAYARYHDNPVAIVVVKDGRVEKAYSNSRFPRLGVRNGEPVPRDSILFYMAQTLTGPSSLVAGRADQWLESEWGKPLPDLYEQAVRQSGGFALILLWAEDSLADDQYDPDENRTAKERYRERQANWNR